MPLIRACRPTQGENNATINCGTTMHAPMRMVACSLERIVIRLASVGIIAALARWNSTMQKAKPTSTWLRNTSRSVAAGSPGCGCGLPPCARTGSRSSCRMHHSATSIGTHSAAVTKNTAWLEKKYPTSPMLAAAMPAP